MVALICMVGNDYQRILDGVDYWTKEESIDSTYFLFDKKNDKYGYASQKNVEDLCLCLRKNGHHPITVGYNPQSFENVFSAVYKILNKETKRYRRYALIDATSTTKEAYGATVTLALMFRNVRIYIVPPEERGWYVPSPEDEIFKEWFAKTRSIKGVQPQEIYLPGQRLKQPDEDEVKVLLRLHDHQGFSDTVTTIIKWCKGNPKDAVVKNRYSRIISRLEDKGFVEKESTKQGKAVHLTHFGKILIEAIKASQISTNG
ncbi:MAG: hypothetical protein V1915_01780 [Candidatus Bathyarchaeota archaeon]